MNFRAKVIAGLPIALMITGCGYFPAGGPSLDAVRASSSVTVADAGRLGYAVVKMSPLVASIIRSTTKEAGFSQSVLRAKQTDIRVGIGDLLAVSVYEASAGGLFNPTDSSGRSIGSSVALPTQQVTQAGTIAVPYAGVIQAAGRTVDDIRRQVETQLKNRAIEPQVTVSMVDRRSGAVSVLGEVTTPQRFVLEVGGSRLLEGVARAGGAKFPAFETLVTLHRRGHIEQIPLISVVRNPAQNIYLEQGDSVVLSREPRSFVVLGATPAPGSIGGQNNRRFLFESENLTLAEALAKAGGLRTEQADAQAVFVYRQESRSTLTKLGVDVSENISERIPTIYQLDLSQADGYFLATEFYIRDRDLVYVSDAPAFEVAKILGVVSSVSGIGLDAARITQ